MENFKIFSKENLGSVRVCYINDTPYFVAKDVCECLGIANNRDAVARLDDDEKNTVVLTDGIPKRGNPNVSVITESGLYALIMRARKAEAREFQRWVTKEVLPSIRENRAYVVGQEKLSQAEKEDLFAKIDEIMKQKSFHAEDSNYWFAMYKKLLDEYVEIKKAISNGSDEDGDDTAGRIIVPVDGVTWTDESGLLISIPSGEKYAVLERKEK